MAAPKSKSTISPRQSLQLRLQTVVESLQLLVDAQSNGNATKNGRRKTTEAKRKRTAAGKSAEPSTSKLLHDLRVSCRRAEIALRICPQELGKKQAAWFRDQLQDVRDSCNVLRDDEVLRKWLRELPESEAQQDLLKSISKNIKAGHNEAAKRARVVLQRRHFQRRVDEARPTRKNKSNSLVDSAMVWRGSLGRSLFASLDRLVQAIPDDPDDYAALHQLRIAAKRMRYAAEFAQELDPTLQLRTLIKLLTDTQDKLGELHDAVVRTERLDKVAERAPEATELSSVARDELTKYVKKWKAWWQKGVLQKLVQQASAVASKLLNQGQQP